MKKRKKEYLCSKSDFEFLLVASLRYGIGRRSYAVSLIADVVKQNIPYLSTPALQNYAREIKETTDYGDEMDRITWFNLLYSLNEEIYNKRGVSRCE